ncbi:MAG: xanthine dehydrogenase accessory protein XdhC [Planctomycetota bacterium]
MIELARRTTELINAGVSLVAVTVVETSGSTPTRVGSKMLVTPQGLEAGTVGGGRVEAKAIEHARAMLNARSAAETLRWRLKADVGMTCGGAVTLFFEPLGVSDWPIVVFGAGHVTQALAPVLGGLPCQLTCVDPRREWLARLPTGVRTKCCEEAAAEVSTLPSDAFVLCMTRGHATDLPILQEISRLGLVFPFLGVIGSTAKAAVLRKVLGESTSDGGQLEFHCPVGLPIGSNHPGEIAVSIAAQLIAVRDELRAPADAAVVGEG